MPVPVVLELVPSHAYHDIAREEPTGIYDPFRLDTEWSLLRDLLTQHVVRWHCEVADAAPGCPCFLVEKHVKESSIGLPDRAA